MIDSLSFMLSRFINGVLRRRPGMPGLDQISSGTLSCGHRPLVHFQLAMGGTLWVATDDSLPSRGIWTALPLIVPPFKFAITFLQICKSLKDAEDTAAR